MTEFAVTDARADDIILQRMRAGTLRWVFIAVALVGVSAAICARWDDWRMGQR